MRELVLEGMANALGIRFHSSVEGTRNMRKGNESGWLYRGSGKTRFDHRLLTSPLLSLAHQPALALRQRKE